MTELQEGIREQNLEIRNCDGCMRCCYDLHRGNAQHCGRLGYDRQG